MRQHREPNCHGQRPSCRTENDVEMPLPLQLLIALQERRSEVRVSVGYEDDVSVVEVALVDDVKRRVQSQT